MTDPVTAPSAVDGTLLLHGAGGGPEANFPFRAELPGRVVASDFRGLDPAPRELDDLVDIAVSDLDDAGVATADVVGYSLGAAVAVRFASRHPERTGRLVLVAGFARASPSLRLTVATWRSLLDHTGTPLGDRRLGRFLAWVGSSEHSWHDATVDPDEAADTIAAAVPPGTDALADLIPRLDATADLAGVLAPTLVVAPADDRLVHPAHSELLLAGIADARRLTLRTGHDVAGEAPAPLREAIAGHLS